MIATRPARPQVMAISGAVIVLGVAILTLSQLIVDWPLPFWVWIVGTVVGLYLLWRGLDQMHIGMGASVVAAALALGVVLVIVVPFGVVVVLGSLQRPVDLLSGPYVLPPQPNLEQFARFFEIPYME